MTFDAAKERERQIQREMTHCQHFTGIKHKSCSVGVAYEAVKDPKARPLKLVCLDQSADAKCDRMSLPTRAEAELIVDERERRIEEVLNGMRLGICQCGVRGESWEQIGPCIYAKPCGHRVGQGDAKKYAEGVAKARAEWKVTP